jgi:hypothetical protein
VNALRTPTLPDSVHEKVGAALACIRHQRGLNERERTWQSFHFARFHAKNALASVKDELDEYNIVDRDWSLKAITPSGAEYSCVRRFWD